MACYNPGTHTGIIQYLGWNLTFYSFNRYNRSIDWCIVVLNTSRQRDEGRDEKLDWTNVLGRTHAVEILTVSQICKGAVPDLHSKYNADVNYLPSFGNFSLVKNDWYIMLLLLLLLLLLSLPYGQKAMYMSATSKTENLSLLIVYYV